MVQTPLYSTFARQTIEAFWNAAPSFGVLAAAETSFMSVMIRAEPGKIEEGTGAREFLRLALIRPTERCAAGCISSHAISRRLNKLSMATLKCSSAVSANQDGSAKVAWWRCWE